MKDLAARLDSASNCETEGLRTVLRLNPHKEPGCAILPLRLIPRLCCAVPPVQYSI